MKGLSFFDTNILIYADDASAKNKRERAISLMWSMRRQLQEYYAATIRKLGIAAEIAQRNVVGCNRLPSICAVP